MSHPQVEGPTFHGGPLPFITISPSAECVVEEYAAKILSQIKGRIAVITVAGMYRTGKSFLMNRLIGMQEGFEIGASVNPCTKGIWIWGQPVQLADDYYAILIDTEGLASGNKSNVDLVIFTLSVLLSSYFIYNSMGPISEDSLDQLAVASTIVRSLTFGDSSGAMTAPPLLWVLRDFNLRLVNELNQPVSPRDYLESSLKIVPTTNGEKNHIREAIKQLFEDRDCLTMVRPLESESELRQINKVPFEALRPVFKQQIETFVEKVYTSIQPKKMGTTLLNGTSFCQLVSQYCAILNSNGGKLIPGISNLAWDNVVQTQLRSSLRDAVGLYRSVLNEEGMKKLPLSDSQLRAIHVKAKTLAKGVFPTQLLGSLSTENPGGRQTPEMTGEGMTGGLNISISAAGEMTSAAVFYKEFRVRREQLFDHLKAENLKVSQQEIERIFNQLVKQIIDTGAPSGSIGLVLESWRTVVSVLESQCAPKYPSAALSDFVSKTMVPSIISTSLGLAGRTANNTDEVRRWADRSMQLESMLRDREMVVQDLEKKIAIAALESNQPRSQTPVIGDQSSVLQELRSVKDLLVSSLTEMKSAESDKRAVEVKAENERNMIELERKFTKQLNEARRKNELMIDDVKRNYEDEIGRMKQQKLELQDFVKELEKQNGIRAAEIEKLNVTLEAGENDRALRANLANVINQQSQLVLQFLKNGTQLSSSQAGELGKLTAQAAEMRAAIRPPLIGGKYSQGA